ncbi:hypothetical protein IQ62_05400 [Streptomyces scabiei]|nr:hypothetical protein IQ62_05400 [Streptomyces scabiei]
MSRQGSRLIRSWRPGWCFPGQPSLVDPFGLYLIRVYAADALPDSLLEADRIDSAEEALFRRRASGSGLLPVAPMIIRRIS